MDKEWARVRLSFLLSFLACLVLLPAGGYIGYLAAGRIAFRYEQSKSFKTLGRRDAEELRRIGETAYALSVSRVLQLQKTEGSLRQDIEVLDKLRPKAAHEFWRIIDLRLAEDHAGVARIEEQANNSAQAAGHRRIAEDLLQSLGWRDVSENALNQLADRRLRHSLLRKTEK